MAEAPQIEKWIRPSSIFNKGRLHTGAVLGISNGRVEIVTDDLRVKENAQIHDFEGILSPGFVDLQVNGGGGILLNETPTKEAIWMIAKAHAKFGTTGIFPTVITDSLYVLKLAVDAVMDAIGQHGVFGIHIEGPHISVERRGTHSARFVRPFDEDTFQLVKKLRSAEVPTMLTLAPEVVSPRNISRLVDLGAVVSIGHSNASASVVRRALKAGASCFTHLFNAMPPLAGREPGVVGAAINSDAFAGIICDGIHVADEMVAMALRARPVSDRMYLVSDSMPTVGCLSTLLAPHHSQSARLNLQRLLSYRRQAHRLTPDYFSYDAAAPAQHAEFLHPARSLDPISLLRLLPSDRDNTYPKPLGFLHRSQFALTRLHAVD